MKDNTVQVKVLMTLEAEQSSTITAESLTEAITDRLIDGAMAISGEWWTATAVDTQVEQDNRPSPPVQVELTYEEIDGLLRATKQQRDIVAEFKPETRSHYEHLPMWKACIKLLEARDA